MTPDELPPAARDAAIALMAHRGWHADTPLTKYALLAVCAAVDAWPEPAVTEAMSYGAYNAWASTPLTSDSVPRWKAACAAVLRHVGPVAPPHPAQAQSQAMIEALAAEYARGVADMREAAAKVCEEAARAELMGHDGGRQFRETAVTIRSLRFADLLGAEADAAPAPQPDLAALAEATAVACEVAANTMPPALSNAFTAIGALLRAQQHPRKRFAETRP